MNPCFSEFLEATPQDRRDVFLSAATRLGTPEQTVEKDFWVAWTLDVLFNGLPVGHPRFLFKGGTSLSKAYGLISRFSEDIDITICRDDLGQDASVRELENMNPSQGIVCGRRSSFLVRITGTASTSGCSSRLFAWANRRKLRKPDTRCFREARVKGLLVAMM
jgi:hypothetical protein